MNISELYEMQKVLDERIIKDKGLEGQDLLPNTVLALQVEIAEMANVWRGFKFWSNDQEPRTSSECPGDCVAGHRHEYFGNGQVETYKCNRCDGTGYYNPLLEEYVDSLHFTLSIGLKKYTYYNTPLPINNLVTDDIKSIKYYSIMKQFNRLFENIGYLEDCIFDHEVGSGIEVEDQYKQVLQLMIGLGEMLGFTWDEICKSYMNKNRVNHERQANGY